MIRAIVHADKEWGIGKNGDMMFSLPKDIVQKFLVEGNAILNLADKNKLVCRMRA